MTFSVSMKYGRSRLAVLASGRLKGMPALEKIETSWTNRFKNYVAFHGLDNAISKISRDSRGMINKNNLIRVLADELNQSLSLISFETEKMPPHKARELVSSRAKDFIELANLSQKGDQEFVRFVIDVLLRADAIHFPDNSVHCGVVTFYVAAIAKEMGFEERFITWGKTSGVLHDIGKIGVPTELLQKTVIGENEKVSIDQHLLISIYLLQEIRWLRNVVKIISHHHPHPLFNGDLNIGKLGGKIYTLAQILRVVDVYDGLTSKRKYKTEGPHTRLFDQRLVKVFTHSEAIEELRNGPYDHDVVDALERVVEKGEEYIFNIKDLFERSEIKFVWPGIEHLIGKNILPFKGTGKSHREEFWLINRAPFLWLISGQKKGFDDVLAFIDYVKQTIVLTAYEKNLLTEFNEMTGAVRKQWMELADVLYEGLFRALNIDSRTGLDTFSSLIKLLHFYREDISALTVKIVDSLALTPEKDESAFFEWLALRLYGENTVSVDVYGGHAFNDLLLKLLWDAGLLKE